VLKRYDRRAAKDAASLKVPVLRSPSIHVLLAAALLVVAVLLRVADPAPISRRGSSTRLCQCASSTSTTPPCTSSVSGRGRAPAWPRSSSV
jgi:hypothetical protein